MPTSDQTQEAHETAQLSELLLTVTDLRARIANLQASEAQALASAGCIGVVQSQRLPGHVSVDRAIPLRSIAAEFGAAMRISDRTAQVEINEAMTLLDDYPATFAAWQKGTISRTHVHAILKAGTVLSDPQARAQFDCDVALVAKAHTPGALRKKAIIMAEKAQPRTLNERHRNAREDRCVWVTDLPDGMAQVGAVLPSLLAYGMLDRLTRQARALKDAPTAPGSGGPGGSADTGISPAMEQPLFNDALGANVPDLRTIDQIRADLLADMILTTCPTAAELAGLPGDAPGGLGAIRAIVQVTVPATTLAGTTETPGDLSGIALVDPESVRRLAGNAPGWDRVFTHPVTAGVLTVDRYRPSDHLKRYLRARDQHCRFPGCRTPVTRCDIDHTIDAAYDGPTSSRNLAHLCRRHHTLKHAAAWNVSQLANGVLRWASPTGRIYTDKPPGVAFEPDLPPTPPGSPPDASPGLPPGSSPEAPRDPGCDTSIRRLSPVQFA